MKSDATYGVDSSSCATRYPMLLVHGAGVRDGKKNLVWGEIPEALRKHGAQVFFGEHDAWGTPIYNAVQLLERLPSILEESGSTKVNIIAHSKGGIDARYLIALLADEFGDDLPVASLTTIATPHQGSRSIEMLLRSIWPVFIPLAFVSNFIYKQIGDKNPDFLGTCLYLTPSNMKQFNASQPDISPVYSQQFASSLHGVVDDPLVFFPYLFVYLAEGPNDGLISIQSSTYDNYRGEYCTADGRGIPHDYLIDLPKRPFSALKESGTILPAVRRFAQTGDKPKTTTLDFKDVSDFYLAITADLKARGL
ncbi:MAG: hypothetical protein FWE41_02060 [Coriobacteriia bacterium]|nr:hypothetical protein [Coriobacteriia bacterium]MCL2751044.1 hypothetical protein [Coriobacteriia bacterium]